MTGETWSDDACSLVDAFRRGERSPAEELEATLAPALDEVAPRERTILYLRFVEDRTQSEIARSVGISQMQVSRLIRRTLDTLREAVA